MQFNQTKIIKSNITTSMDFKKTYDQFAVYTRQLAHNSSKYVYRLQIYDFKKLQKQSTIDVYQSYSEENHYIRFVSDKNLVVVNTKFEIKFYQINPLKLKKNFLHLQPDVYDLQASPDGQLVVLVGRQISIWRTNGFRKIIFPHVIQSSRRCSFSHDSKYMAISTTSEINIYTFSRESGEYQFVPLDRTFQSPTNNQDITSIQFNPTDSNEMVVGFLNVSPQFLKIDTGFFIPQKDIQPLASKNPKKATYMPDGKRFLSSDALNGIGLWPGVKNNLFYKEGLLLYNLLPDSSGTKFLGRVWQQIKLIQIQVECQQKKFQAQCPCPSQYSWDFASYSCQSLVCLQKQFSTGQKKNNQCVCITGYIYDKQLRKCTINCSAISNAVAISPHNNQCYCNNNYSWDPVNFKCVFDCKNIPFSTGELISTQKCQCQFGFQWNTQFKQCICPAYSFVSGGTCVCYENYLMVDGKCIVDCKSILRSVGNAPGGQECQCQKGFYFTELQVGKAGCKLNCTGIPDTQSLSPSIDSCLCIQNMYWSDGKCKINCNDVGYASGESSTKENACNCAVNYLWIDEIHECGRNCSGIANINSTKKSTLKSCPCINNFNWNEQKLICEVDCFKINNTNPYSLSDPVKCECRNAYDWMLETYTCQINCSKIWDAAQRLDNDTCRCNGDKQFNKQKYTCDPPSAQSIFSNIWTILGLVASVIVFLIIMIILIRYCWQFKTKNNKQSEKKLKTNDKKPKKKKTKTDLNDNKEQGGNNVPMSDDRLKTITTI